MTNSLKYLRKEKNIRVKDLQLEKEKKEQQIFKKRRKEKKRRYKKLLERYEEQKMITNVRNKL